MKLDLESERSKALDAGAASPVESEICDLIVRRLRIGGLLTLPFIVLYAASDLYVGRPRLDFLLAIKVVPLTASLVALAAPSLRWFRERSITLAVACVLGLGLTQTLSSAIEADTSTLPVMATALGLTAAVYLPWGRNTQALVSAILFLMGASAIVTVEGWTELGSARIAGSLFGMLVVLGNGPVIASTIRSLVLRNSELLSAKERLTDILGNRLEEANRKLERRGIALEQALEEAEKANLSKSRFLASISHEFRTPLTSILGFAEMLRNGAAGPVTEKQLDYTSEICTSAHHLLHIVDGILTHARIEANEDPIQLTDVPADLLLEVARRQVAPSALDKHITIRRSNPSGAHLLADKQKLLQVMLNLLSNAIKFSPPQSEIGSEVNDLGQAVEIVVWDRGVGLSAADRERIFLPFEQVDRANRTSQKGTGLGLAICKRFIEAHGGTIRVESEPGAGSRFTVWLPKAPTMRQGWPQRESSLN